MSLISIVQYRWQERKRFARLRDWIVSLYDVALRLAPRLPLPLRDRAWPVLVKDQPQPIYLRLGRSDGFVLKEIFLSGVYQPTLEHLREPVWHIVDLGANVGLSVRLWLEHYPNTRVLAVEPDAENFAALCHNIEAADEGVRTRCARVCVASQPGKVYLDRSAEACAIRVSVEPVGEPVDALPMTQLLADAGFEGEIDLLKMDIEGAEADVLAECSAWIGRVKLLAIELHGPYTQARLMEDLERNGARFELLHGDVTAGNPLLVLKRITPV